MLLVLAMCSSAGIAAAQAAPVTSKFLQGTSGGVYGPFQLPAGVYFVQSHAFHDKAVTPAEESCFFNARLQSMDHVIPEAFAKWGTTMPILDFPNWNLYGDIVLDAGRYAVSVLPETDCNWSFYFTRVSDDIRFSGQTRPLSVETARLYSIDANGPAREPVTAMTRSGSYVGTVIVYSKDPASASVTISEVQNGRTLATVPARAFQTQAGEGFGARISAGSAHPGPMQLVFAVKGAAGEIDSVLNVQVLN